MKVRFVSCDQFIVWLHFDAGGFWGLVTFVVVTTTTMILLLIHEMNQIVKLEV